MSIVLVFCAGIFDLATLIPFVGIIMGPIFWAIAGVYLWAKGVGMFGWKKLATSVISLIAEAIPAIQALPMLTVGIVVILILIRIEDKTGKSLIKPVKAGVTLPRLRRAPKNENGVRRPENYTADDEDSSLAI